MQPSQGVVVQVGAEILPRRGFAYDFFQPIFMIVGVRIDAIGGEVAIGVRGVSVHQSHKL